MPSFLKDLTPFYGTGEKNAEGKTLEQFLEDYDPYRYRTPCCTTDAVVFSYSGQSVSEDTTFKVLLVKRKNHPSIGFWRSREGSSIWKKIWKTQPAGNWRKKRE